MSDLLKKRSGNMNESFKKRKNARNSKPDSSAAESRGPLRGPFSDATLEDVEFVFAAFGSDQLQTNVFNDEDEKVRIVFKHFDKDGSGTLSVRELRNALKFYGFSATTRQTEKVLGAYDSTPDGKVDQAEFAKLIKEVSKHNLTFEASEFIGLLSQLVDPRPARALALGARRHGSHCAAAEPAANTSAGRSSHRPARPAAAKWPGEQPEARAEPA